ncbi:MAG: hypothetical protein U0Y68_16690 [Blastocatellia bacterium]
MKKSSNVNEEIPESHAVQESVPESATATAAAPAPEAAPVADRAAQLQAAQEKAAQYLREARYAEAKRVLKEAEQLQAEDAKTQWLDEAKAAREKALLLTDEGKLAEAKQALEEADELEAKAAGWKGRPKRLLAAFRSRLPERAKAADKGEQESAETAPPAAAADP